jgi:putative flippase GtrA
MNSRVHNVPGWPKLAQLARRLGRIILQVAGAGGKGQAGMAEEAGRIARYVIVGGLNTGFGYASYAVLVLLGLPLWLAVAGSTVLALLFNFYSYGALVFGNTAGRLLPRFLGFYAVLGLANFALLRALAGVGVGPLLAQMLLLPLLAAAGYFGLRRFVFGKRLPMTTMEAA